MSMNIEQAILENVAMGNTIILRCSLVGKGIEWLACGTTFEEAMQKLIKLLTNHSQTTYETDQPGAHPQ